MYYGYRLSTTNIYFTENHDDDELHNTIKEEHTSSDSFGVINNTKILIFSC